MQGYKYYPDTWKLPRKRYSELCKLPYVKIGNPFNIPDEVFLNPGCFGPIRSYHPMPRPDEARFLLHLRDPRDVLTSMFYSLCYSHNGPIKGGRGARAKIAAEGIDAFVMNMATATERPYRIPGDYGTGLATWDKNGNLHDRYRRYIDELLGRPNATLVRYEDMICNRDRWLRQVADVFAVPGSANLKSFEEDFQKLGGPKRTDEEENIWGHKRQVTPGDHRRKLAPRTIERLNDIFGDILERLGYSI